MTSESLLRTRWAAVGAAVAVTLGAVGIGGLNIANADVSTGDRPVFVSINPCRLLDTRPGDNNVGPLSAPIGADTTVTIQAHGTNGECTGPSTIPTDAVGLSLNVTAVGPTENTFLTFWGTGDNPGTSNLNPRAGGAPTPNSVSTPLSATGSFNIFNNAGTTNVIVDVNGYYANHNHDDRYYTETEADARYYTETEVDALLDDVPNQAANDERYEQFATTLMIGSRDFYDRVRIDGPVSWEWGDGAATRGAGATDCIEAPFDFPPGVEVTAAELAYNASDAADLEIRVLGEIGQPQDVVVESDLFQTVAEVDITASATASDELGSIMIDLGPDAANIDNSAFHYHAEICTEDAISLYGLRLTLAPRS